jgi:exonuclease 3'-5' domain-containing protein 1
METPAPKIVDTPQSIADLVDELVSLHTPTQGELGFPPARYVDLEGVDLCREGSISLIALLVQLQPATQRTYIIDVHTLGAQSFDTKGRKGITLKDILQDEKIPKVFFDVRNDSDALFAHYGVALRGVEDVQLMESATRETIASRRYLSGLAKCIENNMPWKIARHRADWSKAKETGEKLFKPEHGGSYEAFNERPIPEAIAKYCLGDVQCLPELRNKLWATHTKEWRDVVLGATNDRVASTHAPDYQPHGREKALAPWTDEQNMTLSRLNYVPTMEDMMDEDDNSDFYIDEDFDDEYDYYD